MIKKILLFAATSTLFWSCGSEDNSETEGAAAVPATQNVLPTTTDSPGNALTDAVQAKDGAATPQNAAAEAPANNKADGEVKLNPAHGQPGHSCNIPVGAPLTAAATTPAAAPQAVQMAPASPAAAPQGQQLLPDGKVNPPHGQPGHVCM